MDDIEYMLKRRLRLAFFVTGFCILLTLIVQQTMPLINGKHKHQQVHATVVHAAKKYAAIAPVVHHASVSKPKPVKVIVVKQHFFGSFGFIILLNFLVIILALVA